MYKKSHYLFLISLICLLLAACANKGSSKSHPAQANKEQWVNDVKEADFFFWERFYNRKNRDASEFPQPADWYVPSSLVAGTDSTAWPRASDAQKTISNAAWQNIWKWALDRQTGALMIVRNGRVEYEGYADGHHAGELLAVRSFTKTLPALLVGRAIQDGFIQSLDDPLETYLTEWRGDPRGKIRVHDLLTWSSGLKKVRADKDDPNNLTIRLAEGSDIKSLALNWPQEHAPNTVFAVNQVDQQVAALVIERATGLPYEKYLSKALWRPIGASTATLNLDGKYGRVRTFCCMRASLSDWLRVGELLMNRGFVNDTQVIPAAYVDSMFKPSNANPYMGMSVWNGWMGKRAKVGPQGQFWSIPQEQPYKAKVNFVLGGRSILLWMVPELDLMVVRWGDDDPAWTPEYIINHIIDDLSAGSK